MDEALRDQYKTAVSPDWEQNGELGWLTHRTGRMDHTSAQEPHQAF